MKLQISFDNIELDKAISKGVSNLTKEQIQELTTKLNQYIK